MSFQQGLSGLNAAARNLDVIGNNVANANTAGFKQSEILFADVYANSIATSGAAAIGIGTAVAAVQPDFVQGNINVTSNPLDMAINGTGLFRLDANGAVSYSRNGQFHLDQDGYIVNATGAKVTGYGVNSAGSIVAANPGPIQVSTADLIPTPTSTAAIGLNLDAREASITTPFKITDASTYNKATSMTVYDSLGNSHTLSTYFVKTAANTWSVYGAADGTAISSALGTLKFNADGTLDTAGSSVPFSVSFPLTTGANTPLAFPLDFTGSTQFGSAFGVNALTQDGFTSGKLAGYGVSNDGTILGRYTNGQSRGLGQLVLANFANTQGLQPLGNNGWGETNASGQPLIGTPGTGSL